MTNGNFKLRISLSSFRMCRSKKSSSSSSSILPRNPSAAHSPDKSLGIVAYPKLPPPPPPPPSTPDHPLSKRSLCRVLSFGSSESGCGSYNLIISTPHVGSPCKCKMMKDCDRFHENLCNSPAEGYSSEGILNLAQDESLVMWPIDHTLKIEKNLSEKLLNHEISYAVRKKSTNPYEEFKKSMIEMIVEKEIYEPEELEKLLMCFLSLNPREHRTAIVEAFIQVWEELRQLFNLSCANSQPDLMFSCNKGIQTTKI